MHQAALTLMTTLKREESLFETIEIALDTAKKRSEEIKRIRELFERKIVDRIAHCKELISKSEIAAAERQVADVMGSFEVADVSDTIDRAEERISEDLAEAQARAEIASESGDARMAMVELATETDAAEIELEEYKRQMGFDVGTEGPSERTMPAIETLKTGEIVREDCVSETIK